MHLPNIQYLQLFDDVSRIVHKLKMWTSNFGHSRGIKWDGGLVVFILTWRYVYIVCFSSGLSSTYSTALLYTSMALSVSPASKWTFPSVMKVVSCLFNWRATLSCSSAWQTEGEIFQNSESVNTVLILSAHSRVWSLWWRNSTLPDCDWSPEVRKSWILTSEFQVCGPFVHSWITAQVQPSFNTTEPDSAKLWQAVENVEPRGTKHIHMKWNSAHICKSVATWPAAPRRPACGSLWNYLRLERRNSLCS